MPCDTITTIRVNFTKANLPRLAKALTDAGWQVAVNTTTFVSAYKGGATFALTRGSSQAVISTTPYSMNTDAVAAEATRAYTKATVDYQMRRNGFLPQGTDKNGKLLYARKG